MTRDGTLVTIDGRPALRFERRYRHPMERVWRAISDPAEMAAWFPSNVEGERAIGAELAFVDDAQRAAALQAGEPTRVEGPTFRGTVVAYDPPKMFSFTWAGELLLFELLPDGDGTLLVFTQVLSHQSVAARNGSGWHQCLAQLDRLLGEGAGPEADDWEAVYADYLHRIGPALGVPGSDGSMTWERATHVDADQVRSVTTDPAELAAWGAADRPSDPLRWEIEPAEHGTTYRLTHGAIDADADLAATWHALLIQLDLYLAAGQVVPVDHEPWVEAYAALR
jgi:uncharacterized protein YndB with AHSA1/START domain